MRRLPSISTIVVATAAVAGAVGWISGARFQSAGDIHDAAAAPAPAPITVPVEWRELSNQIVVRGTVRPTRTLTVSLESNDDGIAVLTRAPLRADSVVRVGELLAEVGGRPVFALSGTVPSYRDLVPGLSGDDVLQLERSLVSLGFDPGPVDGRYDSNTGTAVSEMYELAGFGPRTSNTEADVAAAEAAVAAAQSQLHAAERQLDIARSPLPESQRLTLEKLILDAGHRLAAAVAHAADAERSLADDVETARRAVQAAAENLGVASTRLEQALSGMHPDTGAPPTEDELRELEDDLALAEAHHAAAVAHLDGAIANLVAGRANAATEVDSARLDLAIAEAQLTEALAPPSIEPERLAVESARQALDAAESELATSRSGLTAIIPMSEAVFIDGLPATVQAQHLGVGDSVLESVFVDLSDAAHVIEAAVPVTQRAALMAGQSATITVGDVEVDASIINIVEPGSPAAGDAAPSHLVVVLEPNEELPTSAIGVSLRVAIAVASTGGPTLAVPAAAISTNVAGEARIELIEGGVSRVVVIETGLVDAATGLIQIRPISGNISQGADAVIGHWTNGE